MRGVSPAGPVPERLLRWTDAKSEPLGVGRSVPACLHSAYAIGGGGMNIGGILALVFQVVCAVVLFQVGLGLAVVPAELRTRFGVLMGGSLALMFLGARFLWAVPIVLGLAAVAGWVRTRRKDWLVAAVLAVVMGVAFLFKATESLVTGALWLALLVLPAPAILWKEHRKRAFLSAVGGTVYVVGAPLLELVTVESHSFVPRMAVATLSGVPLFVFFWRQGWRKAAVIALVAAPAVLELVYRLFG